MLVMWWKNRHILPIVPPSSGPPCFDMRRRAPCVLASISLLAALYIPGSHATPTLTGSSSNHFDDCWVKGGMKDLSRRRG